MSHFRILAMAGGSEIEIKPSLGRRRFHDRRYSRGGHDWDVGQILIFFSLQLGKIGEDRNGWEKQVWEEQRWEEKKDMGVSSQRSLLPGLGPFKLFWTVAF